jgi:hypothetical protein
MGIKGGFMAKNARNFEGKAEICGLMEQQPYSKGAT